MGPNSREHYVDFIIFKPGYMAGYAPTPNSVLDEKFFSTDAIGKEDVLHDDTILNGETWKGQLGIVELKRAKTFEERSKGTSDRPTGYTSRDLPLLFKVVNEDRKERGLEGEVK